MRRQYQSFEEIDERLKLLKLQRQINIESLKLNLNTAKSNLLPANILANLLPANILGGASIFVQKIILTFLIKKLSKIVRGRSQPELLN
ncbi:MAG: DUF6327 family protein [Maribacter sp.]|nr:DUF6327 family protein [Maribacter sp.]